MDIANKIKVLSDTLEIKITDAVIHPDKDERNFDLVASFTYVINLKGSGVLKQFQQIPYLLVDLHLERHDNTGAYIEAYMWNVMSQRLTWSMLECPVDNRYGTDLNPYNFFTGLLRRAERILSLELGLDLRSLFKDLNVPLAELNV